MSLVSDVPAASRPSLRPILDQSFHGVYLWHARRTLRFVTWVREARSGSEQAGVSMAKMLGPGTGYVFYIAVAPRFRAMGVGGLLLDDARELLRAAGATEIFACVRAANIPSLRLLESRDFLRTDFREVSRSKGFLEAARLWVRMVAAPGETVFVSR